MTSLACFLLLDQASLYAANARPLKRAGGRSCFFVLFDFFVSVVLSNLYVSFVGQESDSFVPFVLQKSNCIDRRAKRGLNNVVGVFHTTPAADAGYVS